MNRSALVSCFVVVASLFAAGCDNKPAGDAAKPADTSNPAAKADPKAEKPAAAAGASVASCDVIKTESLCRQYGEANISAAGADFLKNLCSTGTFKMEACPAAKRVGSCATQEGTKVYYSEGPFPMAADAAEKACKEGVPAGTWKAGQ